MPRTARKKSEESIYHVMVRSVGDINLYKENQDKDKYLELIKRYQIKFGFKVYGYCLMDNHSHMLIDSSGADISKFMHGINQCYAQYFNRKYRRSGHVFGDRFKSKIVEDDRYLITLSAYIHNNPKDLKKYKNKPEAYRYSSLSIYLGLNEDMYEILEAGYILKLFSKILKNSRKEYLKLIYKNEDTDIKDTFEFNNEKTEYRSERIIIKRNYNTEMVLEFISNKIKIEKSIIKMKYNRRSTEGKAIAILLMRRFCDVTIKDICEEIGNINQSRVSMLCKIGMELIDKNEEYKNIIDEFVDYKKII